MIDFFNSFQFQEISSIVKIVFGLLSIVLFAVIIYLLRNSDYLKLLFWQDTMEFFSFRAYGTQRMVKKWNKIKKRLDLPSESEHKLAIIEAEMTLDDIFKRMGFGGETIGDKLKQITPGQISNIEDLFKAHEIRNNIVHDPDYQLSREQAEKTIEIYEETLKSMEVI